MYSLNFSKGLPHFVANKILYARWECFEALLYLFAVSLCGQEHFDVVFNLVCQLSQFLIDLVQAGLILGKLLFFVRMYYRDLYGYCLVLKIALAVGEHCLVRLENFFDESVAQKTPFKLLDTRVEAKLAVNLFSDIVNSRTAKS